MTLATAAAAAVAAWSMDEVSGTRADSVGGLTLTDNNTVASATGMFNNAADFESANAEWLSHADTAALRVGVSQPFSLSLWIKIESFPATGGSTASVVEKYTQGGTKGWSLPLYTDGTVRPSFRVDAGNYWSKVGPTLSTATWYHLALVYPQDGTTPLLYLNGSSQSLTTDWVSGGSALSGISDSGADFQIGVGNIFNTGTNSGEGYYDGLIDDVVLMNNYVLSSGDASAIYNGGTGVAFSAWAGGAPTTMAAAQYYHLLG